MRLLAFAIALILAACGAGVTTPTPSPQPLTLAQLKYRVIDEFGRPFFCDPDFYPIARADEADLARQRFPDLQRDTETFTAIVARLKLTGPAYTADQQLAIYREWKTLNALPLQPTSDAWGFAYIAEKPNSVRRWPVSMRTFALRPARSRGMSGCGSNRMRSGRR